MLEALRRDMKAYKQQFFGVLLIAVVFAVPAHSTCEASTITNSFSINANTGGNSASNGEVAEGESSVEIDLVSEVDGTVVEKVHETFTDTGSYASTTSVSTGDASVTTSYDVAIGEDPQEGGKNNVYSEVQQGSALDTATNTIITSSSSVAAHVQTEEAVQETATGTQTIFTRLEQTVATFIAYVFSIFT